MVVTPINVTYTPTATNKGENKNSKKMLVKDKGEGGLKNKNDKKIKVTSLKEIETVILKEKGENTIRFASQNMQKGVLEKIDQLENVLNKLNIDILFTQEWAGWQGEEWMEKNRIKGYTNFCSFKKKENKKGKNISLVVMSKEQRKKYKKEMIERRKRGTTILVRNEIISALNINKETTNKGGEWVTIDLNLKGETITIINIHAEPDRDKKKKESYFEKIKNLITNNKKQGNTILIGGDTNSVWCQNDTSNREAEEVDKTIRDFSKSMGMKDLMRKIRKNSEEEEEDIEEIYTWEGYSGVKKRIDSFWGDEKVTERVKEVYTLKEKWVQSDHKLIIMDWDLKEKIEREEIKENGGYKKTDNKFMGVELDKEGWELYRDKVDILIKSNRNKIGIIKEEAESINNLEIEGKIIEINKLLTKALKETYEEMKTKGKTEKEKIGNEKEKEEDKEKKKEKKNKFLDSMNLKAFEIKNYAQKGDKSETTKLKKGTDGFIAKMTKIKKKVIKFDETLKEIIEKKKLWSETSLERAERMGNFHEALKITELGNEIELKEKRIQCKKIKNNISSLIYKRREKYRRKERKQKVEQIELEGWKGSQTFYNKVLKRFRKKHSIRKIPKKYLKEGMMERNPEDIKEMVKEWWEKLYTPETTREERIGKNRPWFETDEWKNHKENIKNKFEKIDILRDIEKEEWKQIIGSLKRNKTGGVDRIINKQIKFGPDNLKEAIREIVEIVIKKGELPESWKRTRVHTIYKKGDENDPDNYRGISLLPTMYKIMSKIIARRLINIAEETNMIDETQGVAKLGFSAFNEARTLHNVIEDANDNERELQVMYIDITKAYDRVETWALKEILEEIGLPEKVRNLLVEINKGLVGSTNTDFGETKTFNIKRGLRQGCPLSPLIFCLIIEPLLKWLKGTDGYKFENNKELILSVLAYMDDIILIAKNNKGMEGQVKKLEEFLNFYGMNIADKSRYSKINSKEEDKKFIIQGVEIKEKKAEKAYKYLGFWTALDGNWVKHKKVAQEKHQDTINLIGGSWLDPRVQLKTINTIANTPLEYGFHNVPYNEEELNKLDIKNKRVIKKILNISVRCPTSLIFMRKEDGGMGIRSLKDLYAEINITDLFEVLNFHNKDSLYYKTTIQRIVDLKNKAGIDPTDIGRMNNKLKERCWVARTIALMKKSELVSINNKVEGWFKNSKEREELKVKNIIGDKNIFWREEIREVPITYLVKNGKLKGKEEVEKEVNIK